MPTRIAIVGNGITRDAAPFNDTTWDIWTTGSVASILPRVNEIFDVHDEGMQTADVLNAIDADVVWLKASCTSVNFSRSFPIETLIARFGRIFNCSMTMMLADAIMREPDEIALYGIDFAEGYEPEFRVTFVYLLGLARGMGMKVSVAPGSLVFGEYKTYQYDLPDARETAVRRNLEGWRADKARAERSYEYLRGAIDAAESCLRILGRK